MNNDTPYKNVTILGFGNLGSAICQLISDKPVTINVWEYNKSVVEGFAASRENPDFLPGVVFPENVQVTANIDQALKDTDICFLTIPARFLPALLDDVAKVLHEKVPVVCMAKGFDGETGLTASQIIADILPDNPLSLVMGPSIANEISSGVLTGVVAASGSPALSRDICKLITSGRFYAVPGDDVIGVESGAILKNIYALGMGLVDHLEGTGKNFVGAYLTQALHEMTTLGVAMGGRKETFSGLSGMGDLITTALSEDSHNRKMGRMLAKGASLEEIRLEMGVFAEGYITLDFALALAKENNLHLPLMQLIRKVIDHPEDAINFLADFADMQS